MFWRKKKINSDFNINDTIITNYLSDGLLIFDRDNKVILANPKIETFFEIKREKIIGKSILDLSRFNDMAPLVSLLGGGLKEYFRKELKIRGNFILEVTTVPIKIGGKKENVLVILHDVTREKLSDKMKSEFVTLAAHQLRTPTSAVKWSLKSLLEGDLGDLSQEQKKTIEEAYRTNEKVIELVRDLLDLAQIEEGRYLTNVLLLDIVEEVIRPVINSNKEEIKRRKINFDFKKAKSLPKIMIDKEKMEIAFRNILDNALRYTLAGGKVLVSVSTNDKKIEVQIRDSGIGIPEEQKDKIFSRFSRGSNVMKMETEGTGLGLYISKNIINAHGGKIWFESEEGKGTIFCFTIPVKEKFGEFLTEEFY